MQELVENLIDTDRYKLLKIFSAKRVLNIKIIESVENAIKDN